MKYNRLKFRYHIKSKVFLTFCHYNWKNDIVRLFDQMSKRKTIPCLNKGCEDLNSYNICNQRTLSFSFSPCPKRIWSTDYCKYQDNHLKKLRRRISSFRFPFDGILRKNDVRKRKGLRTHWISIESSIVWFSAQRLRKERGCS